MKRLLAGLALCACLLVAAPALAAEGAPDVTKLVGFIRWSGLLVSVFVIAGTALLLKFIAGVVDQLSDRFAHRRLLLQKVWSFTRFFIYLICGAVVVGLSFQINETVLALVGGTFAVAVGFAMRDLVAAMIAGVTIMLDRPFQVGDRVQYAGQYGDIVTIGLRSVRMNTLDDNMVTIPNNKILTDVTSCGNDGALDMQVGVSLYLSIDQDFELAERLLYETILTSRFAFLEKPIVILVEQVVLDDMVAIKLTGKGYVSDTQYEKPFASDVTKGALVAFREHNLLPPAVLHRQREQSTA